MSRHRKLEHSDAKVKYYCPRCTNSFDRRVHLTRHRITCKTDVKRILEDLTSLRENKVLLKRTSICERCVMSGMKCNVPFPCDQCNDAAVTCYPHIREDEDMSWPNRRAYRDAHTGYTEIVFDSKSASFDGSSAGSASSFVSAGSNGSGRRGPLSRLARVGMQAVKDVTACWRCKVLKKSCDVYDPCALCPKLSTKTGGSMWKSIGCKRGNFQHPHTNLCQQRVAAQSAASRNLRVNELDISSLHVTENIETWLQDKRSDGPSCLDQVVTEDIRVFRDFHESLKAPLIPDPSDTSLPQLIPLEQCAQAIMWNFYQCPPARQVLKEEGSLVGLETLLPHAIVYQAEQEEDQLIAQSLICLRTCAEALRAKYSGLLSSHWHRICGTHACIIDCIASLNMQLGLYAEELTRVFCKGKTTKGDISWWLSAFYSFVIQSYVRRALIVLHDEGKIATDVLGQLETPYTIFYENIRQITHATKDSPVDTSATWKASPLIMKEWWRRRGIFLNLDQLETISSSAQAQVAVRRPLSLFIHLLIYSPPRLTTCDLLKDPTPREHNDAQQYLHLPIRLFAAMNGKKDPIALSGDENAGDENSLDHLAGARLAVDYASWHKNHILCSRQYLERLFEDDGGTLPDLNSEEPGLMPPVDFASDQPSLEEVEWLEVECKVCMTNIKAKDETAILPCLHRCHKDCILAWLQEFNDCPDCRGLVYIEDNPSAENLPQIVSSYHHDDATSEK